MVTIAGSVLIGALFCLAGYAKAFRITPFISLLEKIHLPNSIARFGSVIFVSAEVALGSSLIAQMNLGEIIPITIVLLVLMSGVSYYLSSRGRIENCNCYGSLFKVSPAQGIKLNVLYCLILALAWSEIATVGDPMLYQWVLVIVSSGVCLLFAAYRTYYSEAQAAEL